MTSRPAFVPASGNRPGVLTESFAFTWNTGFARSQKIKNVMALHRSILENHPEYTPLEISSKSTEPLGVAMSAFNLAAKGKKSGERMTVESVFQASKVFQGNLGPHPEWYPLPSKEVRDRVKAIGDIPLTGFRFGKEEWPLMPSRLFYDWIYCKTLDLNPEMVEALETYDCFTDIEFNPVRSINCQAYAVALYLSLKRCGVLAEALQSREAFTRFHPVEAVGLQRDNKSASPKKGRKTTSRKLRVEESLFALDASGAGGAEGRDR